MGSFIAPAPEEPVQTTGGAPMWLKGLVGVLAACVVGLGYAAYRLDDSLSALQKKEAAAENSLAQLNQQIGGTRADLKSSTAALASQLGMTQKQLEQRASALRREQQQAEQRLTEDANQQKQQLSAVSGELGGVKTEVGAVKSQADATKSDLAATQAKLERTIGDLNVQSGLIAHTRDDLEIVKHRGDRNIYEFTLAKNSKRPTPVATVSLQLKKVDPKHGKFTLAVVSDDKTIDKKDKNLYEPLQFYSGKDHNLFEVVVFTLDKNKVTGYLSTPKSAPGPIVPDKSGI